jgi:hypothetical protein
MIKELAELWTKAESPTDYIVAMWIYLLLGLFTISWIPLVIELITNPSRFSNITFGVFDYI